MYIRETVADSPLTRINFQPSCAQCEIYLYTFFIRVVMVVWDRRCVDAFGRNRNQTGCTIEQNWAQEDHRDLILTQHYLMKDEKESRQFMLQECCHSAPPLIPAKWAEYLYNNVTFLFCNPGGFLAAKQLETEGIVDNELSHFLSHCCGVNNGVLAKISVATQTTAKERKMFEKLIHKQALDVSGKKQNG